MWSAYESTMEERVSTLETRNVENIEEIRRLSGLLSTIEVRLNVLEDLVIGDTRLTGTFNHRLPINPVL